MIKRDDKKSDFTSVICETAGSWRGNGIQRDGEDVGILCGAALQCLRRPCATMHVRTAVLGVAERFADDAATAQRGDGLSAERAGGSSEESGGGGRTAASA